jgi:hypothetical protein
MQRDDLLPDGTGVDGANVCASCAIPVAYRERNRMVKIFI